MIEEERPPNERLRRARLLKGWTQSQLAEAVGTNNETVSRWERGITLPTLYYRSRLCDALDASASELGFLTEPGQPPDANSFHSVFLACAYADAEKEVVASFKADLQAQGFSFQSSRTMRSHGLDHPRKALQEAIQAAHMVLLVASLSSRSSRHIQQALHLARIYQRPLCALWIEGPSIEDCLPSEAEKPLITLDARQRLDRTWGSQIAAALEQASLTLSSRSASLPIVSPGEPSSTVKPHIPRNPYKGLAAFQREDAGDFFGRERLINTLLAALTPEPPASERLLTLIGPSGSGKSSLVLAGLLPCLQKGALPGSEAWLYLPPVIPGAHPLESLALAFAPFFPEKSLHTLSDDLEDDSVRSLHLLVSALPRHTGQRVFLFVDQAEELFTQTLDEEERQHFIELLIHACTEPGGPLFVVLSLRADFYDRLARYPTLYRLIEHHQHLILPMEVPDLRAVIEQPAALPDVNLTFEKDLVGDLLVEMQGQTGILPLLQFTLDQLFDRRQESHLTRQAYQDIGGLTGALSRHAESTYTHLPSEEHRRLARLLFLRLIEPGPTAQETTRRRAPLSEFTPDDSSQHSLLHETLESFINARLLTANTLAGVPTVEVSHEAVIQEWERLGNWLREAREDLRIQQAISKDVAAWEQSQQRPDRLYRGSHLREAQAWAKRNLPSGQEAAFLRASVTHARWTLVRMALLVMVLVSTSAVALWSLTLSHSISTTVTIIKDTGSGSLRQVLSTAKAGSTITFAPALIGETITLTSDLDITQSVSIEGPGPGKLFLSSENDNDVLQVLPGVTATFSGLSFVRSRLRGIFSFINNMGNLTISQCSILDNATYGSGGGITNQGELTISDSLIAGNSSLNTVGFGGGGIFNQYQGVLTLINSTIANNRANASGGGIENQGTLIIQHSTISGNASLDASGGGIRSGGMLSIQDSTIADNTSLDSGGGIENQGQLSIQHSTVSQNTTSNQGGGIDNTEVLTISNNSLIQQNRASVAGGGIADTGKLTISATQIVYNTTHGTGGGIDYQENVLDKYAPSTLHDCFIANNTAHNGGGLFQHGLAVSQHLKIDNTIVASNSAFINPNVAQSAVAASPNLRRTFS